jgi:hypothetical protein
MLRELGYVTVAAYLWGVVSRLGWRHALRFEEYVRAHPERVPDVFYRAFSQ